MMGLETVYLDSLGVKLRAYLVCGEELIDLEALITLELDHVSHHGVGNNGAIASCEFVSKLCRP